jgi:ubiquinone biosynthesis protein COQ4
MTTQYNRTSWRHYSNTCVRYQSTSTSSSFPFPFPSSSLSTTISSSIPSIGSSIYHTVTDNVSSLQSPFEKIHIDPSSSRTHTSTQTHQQEQGININTTTSPSNDWLTYHSNHYIPLSPLQRTFLFLSSAALSTINTHRGDLVAAVGELVPNNHSILRQLYRRMQQSEEGRRVLQVKPRIYDSNDTNNVWSLSYLSTLKPNTLGGVYYKFMSSHGYTPNDRSAVRFVVDSEYAYIIQRYREIHDIWHILLGFDVSVVDELAQKYFEYLHTNLPLGYLSYLIAPLKLSQTDLYTLYNVYVPSLRLINSECVDLMCIMYEDYLTEDINVLRDRWRIQKVSNRED